MRKKQSFIKLIRTFVMVLCCVALITGLTLRTEAIANAATITVGPVTLNGQVIDNKIAKYPLLLYKNITYIPMTYHLCRFLKLETNWDNSTRTLSIIKSNVSANYVPDTGGNNKKGGTVTVTKVNYPVVVNGVSSERFDSTWPLLNYNGVTYFPLTWQYAVDAFGWDYTWDAVNGLRINSKTSLETPDEEIRTNDAKLDAALNILSSHYMTNRSYSGTLNGPDDSTSKSFLAEVSRDQSVFHFAFRFSADPFVFFRNGVGVSADYLGGGLDTDPSISFSGTGGMLEAEEAALDFEQTEQGYLSACLLDFQFSGNRIGKIKNYKMVSQNNDMVTWRLSVEFVHGNFAGYDAELVVDTKLSTVESIKLETKNYSLLMTPVK